VDALADRLIALPDAATMRDVDRWAIEERGIAGLDLMERAGAGVARALERLVPDGPIAVACGKGNNGGDGLVAARLLRDAGREVRVLCTSPPEEFSGDALANLERLGGAGPVRLNGGRWGEAGGIANASGGPPAVGGGDASGALAGVAVVVDALLGTGFDGAPRGASAEAIAAINHSGLPVVSVDVPSGVDASTGVVRGAAVRATVTVTFHAAKPGLWIRPGKAHAGTVEVLDIGIPRGAPTRAETRGSNGAGGRGVERAPIGLIAPTILELLPRRGAASTKFTSGHVVIVGGSRDLSGAPSMAAQASMRAGAGYVTACVPLCLRGVLQSLGPAELMVRGFPEEDGWLAPDAVADVAAEAARGGALALGPGLGRGEPAFAFARLLARAAGVPLVLDADGLNAHAGCLEELAGREHPTVLTPHAGELGRLLEVESAAVERERLEHVRTAAARAQAVVVLKGDDTLVADADGQVAVSAGNSPALATAGSGDVLSGIIAALLAQGLDAFAAAAAAVQLHADAGRRAAFRRGSAEGVIATDLIAVLPEVRGGSPDPSAVSPGTGR
jgi:NAD(P)H-hydrate epimerase